jgi:hypothetical protein
VGSAEAAEIAEKVNAEIAEHAEGLLGVILGVLRDPCV